MEQTPDELAQLAQFKFDIRAEIAGMDEEAEDWEELGENHTTREYEDHEDTILAFADTAETWIRTALEVLPAEAIDAVDDALTARRMEVIMGHRRAGDD